MLRAVERKSHQHDEQTRDGDERWRPRPRPGSEQNLPHPPNIAQALSSLILCDETHVSGGVGVADDVLNHSPRLRKCSRKW